MGNERVFTLLLKLYLLTLAHTLLQVKCRYVSSLHKCRYVSSLHKCNTIFFQSCSFFSSRFFSRAANLSSGMNDVHATRQVCRPAGKTAGKKLHSDRKKIWLHLCKLETCTYISLAAIYGLNFSSRVKIRSFPMLFNGRTLIFTFSRTQVRIAEHERLQSLFKMSMKTTVKTQLSQLKSRRQVTWTWWCLVP